MKKMPLGLVICLFANSYAQTPTWSEDIAPILYANCTKCHHLGGAGHFSLLTFSDAYAYGYAMEGATSSGAMPPWPPDENYKHFARERVLSQADIDKISQWVAGGRQQGDITLAPAQPSYPNTSVLGTVDLSVRIPAYTVGSNTDVYRNFPITTTVPAGRYITGIEVIPGNTHIVHHVLIYQDSTNGPAIADANDPGPGYTNAGGTGSTASVLIGGYTPGASPYFTPVGTGFRLPDSTNIVVQVHYPSGSQGLVDSTRVNFRLTTVPQREITVWPIVNHLQNMTNGPINVPANTNRTYYEEQIIPANYTVLTAFPHMHLIGRTIKSWANKTTAPYDTVRFVNIPDWDFHWQDTYVFPNAVKVPSGYKIQAVATYDNTVNNPNNPSIPPQTVTAGNGTTDEMMMVFFSYMPYLNGDENLIIDRRVLPQGATTFCNGQSVDLQMIEGTGYTYQWYRNGVAINNATSYSYTATQAGNYHALISLGPNNSLSDTIVVSVSSSPTAVITATGNTAICPNSAVTLNASTGTGYTYQWLNNGVPITNATSASYNATVAGSYTVQVYNGCYAASSPMSVTITAGPGSTVTPSGSTVFCQGGSVTLSAPAGLTYLWSNGATTQTINVTQSGGYRVTVTNGNSCSASSALTVVTVNALPSATVTFSGAITFCQGGNVTLSAAAGLSYLWSNTSTVSNIIVNQSGTYTVTVTNMNNCSAVSTPVNVVVHTNPSAAITANGATVFCQGGSVELSANANPGYQWSNNSNAQTIIATQGGTYTVTVTDANNCSASTSIAVTQFAPPDATVTSDIPTTICPGDSVTLTAANALSYLWNSSATSQAITVSSNGIFTVTITDNNSCTAVSLPITVMVSNNAVAGVTASGPTTFCEGGSVELTASSGISYMWSNGATTQAITSTVSGSYSVTVTASGSCIGISTPVNVTVNPNPAVPAIVSSNSNVFCADEYTNLSAPAGYTYLWSTGSSDQTITVTQSGNYVLTVTDANLCSAVSAGFAVTVNPLPLVEWQGAITPLCSDVSALTLTGGNPAGGTYSGTAVTAGAFDPMAAGVGSFVITYTYTDSNGCISSTDKIIDVTICSGVKEAENMSVQIQPNPSNGNFEISWSSAGEDQELLQIYTVAGQLLQSEQVMKAGKVRVDISGVAAGCYLVRLQTNLGYIFRKLIIQK